MTNPSPNTIQPPTCHQIECCYYEIYNEMLKDLLNPDKEVTWLDHLS